MRNIPCLAGLTLVLGLGGQALSGECTKIRSSYAHAVCDDVQINTHQAAMEMAYAHLLQPLSGQNRSIVKQGQRSWREFASLVCTDDALPQTFPYEGYPLECVVNNLNMRQQWLERNWEVNNIQTFPSEVFLAHPDPNKGIGPPVGSFAFSTTLLNGDNELVQAFNAYARAGYSDSKLRPENDLAAFNGELDIETQISIYEITPHRISSVVEIYAYYHGSAHGGSSINYEHFLTNERRPLVASDIFNGPDWQQRLIEITEATARNDPKLKADIWEDISDATLFAVEPDRWKFTQEGLEIQFQPYELAAYAYGLPAVLINWDELGNILAPGALEIIQGN